MSANETEVFTQEELEQLEADRLAEQETGEEEAEETAAPITGGAIAPKALQIAARQVGLTANKEFNQLVLADPQAALRAYENVLTFQIGRANLIRANRRKLLKKGDTFKLPGMDGEALGRSGAEVLAKAEGVTAQDPILIEKTVDPNKETICCNAHSILGLFMRGFCHYVYLVRVVDYNTGLQRGAMEGEALSTEEKFCHRNYYENEIPAWVTPEIKAKLPSKSFTFTDKKTGERRKATTYSLPVQNVSDLFHNIRMRAQKRAYVNAVKQAIGIGEIFSDESSVAPGEAKKENGRAATGKISGGQIKAFTDICAANGWFVKEGTELKPTAEYTEAFKAQGYASRSDIKLMDFDKLCDYFGKPPGHYALKAKLASNAKEPELPV